MAQTNSTYAKQLMSKLSDEDLKIVDYFDDEDLEASDQEQEDEEYWWVDYDYLTAE